jgi:hypothetical protein
MAASREHAHPIAIAQLDEAEAVVLGSLSLIVGRQAGMKPAGLRTGGTRNARASSFNSERWAREASRGINPLLTMSVLSLGPSSSS